MKKVFNSLLTALLVFALVLPLAVYSDYPETKIYTHEDYLVEYRVMNSWENAQNITVTISNMGDNSIISWAVKYNAGGEITGLWNGVIYKSKSENYIIKNVGYNSEIKPNESITFGYTLSGEDLTVPEDIEICSHRSVKSSGFKVEMIETGNWGTGFQAEINISNLTDKPIEAWELSFDGNFAIEEIWNAKLLSEEENTYKTAGLEGNITIQPNSSVMFGIRANKEEDIHPFIGNIVLSEMIIDDNFTSDSEGEDERGNSEYGIYSKDISDESEVVQNEGSLPYVRNQLLVMADDSVSFKDIEAYTVGMNAEIVGYIKPINKYQIEFNSDVDYNYLKEKINEIKLNPLIENVSLNYAFEISESSVSNVAESGINDVDSGNDWNLKAINVFRAWDYYDKMTPTKIGVIDRYFDENHNDISYKKVWKAHSDIDDYVELGENEKKHGTHVAGIMAAKFNNRNGNSGICPKNELYCHELKKKRFSGGFTLDTSYSELIESGVKVINVSFGNIIEFNINSIAKGTMNKEYYDRWKNAVNGLYESLNKYLNKGYDFVIVSAAGNYDFNTTSFSWINCIDKTRVKNHIIVVSSIGNAGDSNYFASPGLCYGERIDVAAPGENILSTVPYNSYDIKSGTSMAAPHVSGIAGMMYSVNPDISGTEIKEIIKGTSKLRTVKDSHGYEYGIADARLAVSTAYYHQADNPDKIVFGKLEDKNDPSNKFANVKIAVSYDGQERSIYSDDNGEFEIVIPKETETGSLKYQIDGYAASAKVEAEYLRSTAVVNVDLAPSDSPAYLSDLDYALYSALPEPEANEIYALVRVAVSGENLWIFNYYTPGSIEGEEYVIGTIDYGDGTSAKIDVKNYSDSAYHTYAEAGDYIVKITYTPIEGEKNSFSLRWIRAKFYPIGVKIGSDVIYDETGNYIRPSETDRGMIQNFKYVKFNSDYWCSEKFSFTYAYDLQRIEYTASKKFSSLNGYGSYGKFSCCYALDFSNLIDLFSEITEVPSYAFNSCYCLTDISLPKCTKIDDLAFSECYSLKSINIPNCTEISVNTSFYYAIGAFYQCRSLVMINLPVCESIGEDAFYGCNSLQKVYAPQCREVGSYAFGYCSALTDVKLSDSCIYGDDAFIGCTRLVPSSART